MSETARVRHLGIVALAAVLGAGGLSACADDLLEDDFTSLWNYTCSESGLRDAGTVARTLSSLKFRADVLNGCDSGPAYIGFRPAESVEHTAQVLDHAFACHELAIEGARPGQVVMDCRSGAVRFVVELSWTERKTQSGETKYRRYGQATVVGDEHDKDAVLDLYDGFQG